MDDTPTHIVSLSKDTLLKLWNLSTQHCQETIVSHRGEAWAMDVSADESMILTAGSDQELNIWQINKDFLFQEISTQNAENVSILCTNSLDGQSH